MFSIYKLVGLQLDSSKRPPHTSAKAKLNHMDTFGLYMETFPWRNNITMECALFVNERTQQWIKHGLLVFRRSSWKLLGTGRLSWKVRTISKAGDRRRNNFSMNQEKQDFLWGKFFLWISNSPGATVFICQWQTWDQRPVVARSIIIHFRWMRNQDLSRGKRPG